MSETLERIIPAPSPNEETREYWDAANAGRFLVKRCQACGKVHWYPRAVCPFCMSGDTVWEQASGRGTIYSFSPMRQAKAPFVVAFVTLEEGPTMLTNIVDCDPDGLFIGQAVRVTFKPTDGEQQIPVFRPV